MECCSILGVMDFLSLLCQQHTDFEAVVMFVGW